MVALSASRNLAGVLNIDLIFAKPQIIGNGFNYGNAIVSQPVIDIWCEGMFSSQNGVRRLIIARSESSKGAS